MINFEQLRQLILFSKYKTLSRVAEELFISQPALTRSIQKIEKNFNTQLFNRTKNQITLNKNGEIAIKYAEKILKLLEDMKEEIYENDRIENNFVIGACTPSPLWSITSLFLKFYFGKYNIITKIENNSELIAGLKNDNYQMIILSKPYNEHDIQSVEYEKEELFLSVPQNHKLAKKKGIYFSDIEDDKMLLFNPIGIWRDIVFKKMPNMNFLIQSDGIIFKELAKTQKLLSFSSNLVINREGTTFKNNILIPILDKEAKMVYYLVFKKGIKRKIEKVLENLKNK